MQNFFSGKNFLIVIFVFGVVFISIGITYLRLVPSKLSQSLISRVSNTHNITPTPFPFAEMTVPYLRDRVYRSQLNDRERYTGGSNYTSYLTSYDSDGLRINGLLTIPDTQMPNGGFPAIVFVHGYIPPAQYATTEKYVDYVDYLARNGFVVFKTDLRGHGNSEGTPGGGYYSSDYVIDTLNARAALQASNIVNPNKVGLWGHSMAGNVVMRSMVARPEIPAAVIWAGAVYSYEDQRKYGIQDSSYQPLPNNIQRRNRRSELYAKVGSPSAQSPFWRQVAPIYFLNDLKGAVSLNHAVDDSVVNIGYSRDLNAELDKTNVPHELNEYPSGGHNIEGVSFVSAMENTVRFFKKYLSTE
jgi:dipeptidyl aminopeptidase/acylaminoacyl peptidase